MLEISSIKKNMISIIKEVNLSCYTCTMSCVIGLGSYDDAHSDSLNDRCTPSPTNLTSSDSDLDLFEEDNEVSKGMKNLSNSYFLFTVHVAN